MAGTWIAKISEVSWIQNAHHLSLENPTGSGKVVKVYRVGVYNDSPQRVTGILSQYRLDKLITLTTTSGGTSVIPQPLKTNNTALGTVTAYTKRTYTTVGTTYNLRKLLFSNDEIQHIASATSGVDELETMWSGMIWDSSVRNTAVEPIVLRENQALTIVELTASPVNNASFWMEFTVE